jgi:hypothetical protein
MSRIASLRTPAAVIILLIWGPALLTQVPTTLPQPTPPIAGQRMTVLISDLHMGLGKVGNPQHWHPYEDFRWTDEFGSFLREIDRQGASRVDLVLNGDSFELWQSSQAPDCVHADKDLGCTEDEALARAAVVFAAHNDDLSLLRDFAERGSNHVFFVPGNHDVSLLYERVAETLLKALGARAHRVDVLRQGYWLSEDGWIYAEHGHQIDDLNRFAHWPTPFVLRGKAYLEKPWGEQFVHSFYDHYEEKYPIIDNIEGELNGIRYGLASEGVAHSTFAVGRFAKFYALETSLQQFASSLAADSQPPKHGGWDIAAIRNQGDSFLVQSVPEDDPIRPFLDDAFHHQELGMSVKDLTAEEIEAICDNRAGLVSAQLKAESEAKPNASSKKKPSVGLCPAATLSAAARALTDPLGNKVLSAHLQKVRDALVDSGKSDHSFTVAVFSHTHKALDRFDPNTGKATEWHPAVYNTGAWQRIVTRPEMEQIRKDRALSVGQVLVTLQPEDLPACYPVVVIRPYAQGPDARLLFWRRGADQKWALASSCS